MAGYHSNPRPCFDRITSSDQLIQIHRRCGKCILCIEVPLVLALPCKQIADRLGTRVSIVLSLVLLQRIAMDLAQRELLRILRAPVFPADVRPESAAANANAFIGILGVQVATGARAYARGRGVRSSPPAALRRVHHSLQYVGASAATA